jgi:hypothetical protein
MKKSFLYFIPAALILALLFAGCPQEAEEDDGGVIPSYQKDVDGIAVAFADGAPVVYLKDNLHLGDSELVIPAGKTLDLSRSVTIDQIGARGKLIVVGNITPDTGENRSKYDILLYKAPGAKIIITESQYNAYVDDIYVEDDEGSVTVKTDDAGVPLVPNPDKFIKAFDNQVIKFATFDIGSAQAWETYIKDQALTVTDNTEYVPLLVGNGTVINKAIGEVISTYGSGRRVYIIGDVTVSGLIDLTGPTWYPSAESRFNVIDDADGSLLIGGAVAFDGGAGEVKTTGGLTVLGTLTTKGDRDTAKVNAEGPLVAYLLRLTSGGGGFGGPVTLIGSLPSKFGGNAVFNDTLTARGTVIIDEVTFKKAVTFNGPVEFMGNSKSVTVEPGTQITLNGPVTLSNSDPVNVADTTVFNAVGVPTFTYDNDVTLGPEQAIKDAGSIGYAKPVIFNGKVVIGTQSYFNQGVVFNSDATFNLTTLGDGEVHFGSLATGEDGGYGDPEASAYFAKAVSIGSGILAGGSIGVPVTFRNTAAIAGDVDFISTAVFDGNLTLTGAGTFGGTATFAKDTSFPAGSQVTLKAPLNFPGMVINLVAAPEGYLTPDAADTGFLKITGDTLTFGGTLTVGSASIDISKGGKIVIGTGENTGIIFGTEGVVSNSNAYIVSTNYEVLAGTSAGGTLVGLFGTVTAEVPAASLPTITLSNSGITGSDTGTQSTLRFAGSNAVTDTSVGAPNLQVKKNVEIAYVTLDLAEADDKLTAGSITISGSGNPIITLKGGTVAVGGGTVVTGAAGGIRVEGTTGVYGAAVLTSTGAYTADGYIVSNGGKKFVAGTAQSGTISEAGTIGTLGVADANATAVITARAGDDDQGFVLYPETFQNGAGVVTFINAPAPKRYVDQDVGGSIAVFAGTIAAN